MQRQEFGPGARYPPPVVEKQIRNESLNSLDLCLAFVVEFALQAHGERSATNNPIRDKQAPKALYKMSPLQQFILLYRTWVTLGVTVTILLKSHAKSLTKRVQVTRVRRGMVCRN